MFALHLASIPKGPTLRKDFYWGPCLKWKAVQLILGTEQRPGQSFDVAYSVFRIR